MKFSDGSGRGFGCYGIYGKWRGGCAAGCSVLYYAEAARSGDALVVAVCLIEAEGSFSECAVSYGDESLEYSGSVAPG